MIGISLILQIDFGGIDIFKAIPAKSIENLSYLFRLDSASYFRILKGFLMEGLCVLGNIDCRYSVVSGTTMNNWHSGMAFAGSKTRCYVCRQKLPEL